MHRATMLAIAAVLALGMSACGGDDEDENGAAATETTEETAPAPAAGEQEAFELQLEALNESGVDGTVTLEPGEGQLGVSLEASNTTPDQQHLAHLHIPEQGEATCPTVEEHDSDGDGRVSLEEGLPAYGPVAVEFMPFPEADSEGNLSFEQTLDVEGDPEVARGAVVVHGAEVDGEFQAPLPVACVPVE